MLDKNLLQALKTRKRYEGLYTSVPTEKFDQNTVRMLKWFGVYFGRYPEHEAVDVSALETLIKLEGKLDTEQFALTKRLLQGLDTDIDNSIVQATAKQLEALRFEGSLEMLLRRYQDGAEVDLLNEVRVLAETTKQRSDTQEKALWADGDVREYIKMEADESGYKLTCLPPELHENLRGLTAGTNVGIAMPTDAGKTSLFCRIAVCFAQQHMQFLLDGTEEKFRPILYLINEGLAESITPRVYQTALQMNSTELFALASKPDKDHITEAYCKVVGRRDAIRLVNIHGMSTGQVARIIEAHDPFCVFTDMTGRIKALGAQGANDVAQLETVWDTMRQLSAIHKFIHIGSAQISVEGMNTLYPPLTALQNSKTGIQTTLDLALWGGAYLNPTDEVANMRGLSTPKNKRKKAGAKGYLKVDVVFDSEKNLWK